MISAMLKFYFPIVDVRDVASAHLRAMITPTIKGRYCLCHGPTSVKDMIQIVRSRFANELGVKIPTTLVMFLFLFFF